MGFDFERGDGRPELHAGAGEGSAGVSAPLVEQFGQAITKHLLAHRHALERYRTLAKCCGTEPALQQLVQLAINLEEQHGRLLDALLGRLWSAVHTDELKAEGCP